jgi:serine/threonine protein kinase/WD40 repeat protein
MTDLSTDLGPDDVVLLQFQQEYEEADDKGGIVAGYCARHPELAPRIRARAALVPLLGRPEPAPAERLPERFGEFRVVRRIGGGGMGQVYEARHDRLNRRVAVKTIRPDRASPAAVDRFRREQRALARLHQTHIVSIFEAGEQGPLHYFAMPYIDGAPLSSVVQTALRHETSVAPSQTPSLGKLAEQLAGERRKAGEVGAGGTARLALSAEYFRSVAGAMADAAEAIQHAHDAGLLHRDVKPSNLMVDRHGHCWVIDFGLAGEMRGRGGEGAAEDPVLAAEPVTTTGVVGTPQYMAPEQWARGPGAGGLDARTDVYGLGVTLYELLTLRRAFDGESPEAVCAKVLEGKRLPIEELTSNTPPDLAAICRKATQKEREDRYATAQEFADDLRRWLRHEPTKARGAWAGRRVWLWSRRNPGWAAAILALGLACAGAVVAGAAFQRVQADRARTEGAMQEQANEAKRQALIRAIQDVRWHVRTAGWRNNAWGAAGDAAALRCDDDLRNQAAATCVGLDARPVKVPEGFGASAVAFSPDGKRLLLGAVRAGDKRPARGASVWEAGGEQLIPPSSQTEPGPVAFLPDGRPVQLVPGRGASLQLWDVANGKAVQQFRFGTKEGEGLPVAFAQDEADYAVLALSPGAFRVAASGIGPDGKGTTAVWDGDSGGLVFHVPLLARALALSQDGSLLAAADTDKRVTVWNCPTGKKVASFRGRDLRIHALAFSPDASAAGGAAGRVRGRVAAGGEGGVVVIWDVGTKFLGTQCFGSYHDVYTVAFSPDGSVLATGGHVPVRLWDAASGRHLLDLPATDGVTGIAFSPDGGRLAVSSDTVPDRGGLSAWELEGGRGILTLRGLSGRVAKVHLSPDGSRLAALAHDWRIGIWDTQSGRLLRTLEPPAGWVADNSALAFSADAGQLAFAAGEHALLWEVASGKELRRWNLPMGLTDNLAFDAEGRLLLFRTETVTGGPWGDDPAQDPRVCRLRNLLGEDPVRKPIKEIGDFRWHVLSAVGAPDGRYFVAEGVAGPGGASRSIKAFDGTTGEELWSQDAGGKSGSCSLLTVDPTGKVLGFEDRSGAVFVEMPANTRLRSGGGLPGGLAPGLRYTATGRGARWAAGTEGLELRGADGTALVVLGLDQEVSTPARFDRAGTRLAWGNTDGTVMVCDIAAVWGRLAEIGLRWE